MKVFLPLIGFIVFTLAGCFSQKDPAVSKTLTMGTSMDDPPFSLRAQGEAEGFDIDLARIIADRMEFKLEIQDMEFNALIPALQNGRVDFVMAAVTVTEERKKSVDFSRIYYKNTFALISKKGTHFNQIEDLGHKTIGVQLGSTMENTAKELAKTIKGMKVLSLGKNPILIEKLKSGQIDAILMELIQAEQFVKNHKALEYSKIPQWENEVTQGYAIAFPKKPGKNPGLREKFDQVLQQLEKEGVLQHLQDRWLR